MLFSMAQRKAKQLGFDLRYRGRGGYRPGAGRPKKPGAGVPHVRRPALGARHPVHVTARVRDEAAQLRSRACFRVVASCIGEGCQRDGFRLVHFSLVEVLGEYQAVRDAFYGAQPIVVPIDMTGRGRAGDARLGAMQNGMLVGRDRNAQRARERLIAVLPFDWGLTRSSATFELSAQLLGNPAFEPPPGFAEFAPIPRFIFSERRDDQTVMMRWEPAPNPKDWSHRP